MQMQVKSFKFGKPSQLLLYSCHIWQKKINYEHVIVYVNLYHLYSIINVIKKPIVVRWSPVLQGVQKISFGVTTVCNRYMSSIGFSCAFIPNSWFIYMQFFITVSFGTDLFSFSMHFPAISIDIWGLIFCVYFTLLMGFCFCFFTVHLKPIC